MHPLTSLIPIVFFLCFLSSSRSLRHLSKRCVATDAEAIAASDNTAAASKRLASLDGDYAISSLKQPTKQRHLPSTSKHQDGYLAAYQAATYPSSDRSGFQKEANDHSEMPPKNSLVGHTPGTPATPESDGPNVEEELSTKTLNGRLRSPKKYLSKILKKTKPRPTTTPGDTRKIFQLKQLEDCVQKIQFRKLERLRKIRHGQLEPIIVNGEVILPSRPPTQTELEMYRRSRDQVAVIMANGHKRDGDDINWTPEGLAQFIGERLAQSGNPSNVESPEAFKKSISLYQTYLEDIREREQRIKALESHHLMNKWKGIERSISRDVKRFLRSFSKAKPEAMQEVIRTLHNVNRNAFRGDFDKELRAFISGIESRARFKGDGKPEPVPAAWAPKKSKAERLRKERERRIERETKWEPSHTDMRRYIPNAVYDQSTEDYFQRFAKARAAQTTNKPVETTHIPTDPPSTVEEIIRTLPKDLELVKQINRFIMISGLENILTEISPQVTNFVEGVVVDQLGNIFPTLGEIKSVLGTVLKSTQEEDVVWRESLFRRFSPIRMSTEAVYKKLQQGYDPRAKIRLALDKSTGPATSLPKEDLEVIKKAPSTRRTLRKLTKMENFKEPASGTNFVNNPFIEELFEKGIIDPITRLRLHVAGRKSKEELVKSLGSEAEFKKLLLEKHAEDILQHCIAPESQQVEVVKRATIALTQTFLFELDQKAKSLYLTRDAFLKPNSFRGLEAWMIYDQQAIREFIQSPASYNKIIKAAAESYFPEPPQQPDKSMIDQLLSEMKISQEPKENILANVFTGFDDRLFELLDRKGDDHLKGTSFATLVSQNTRDRLTKIIQEFHTQRDTLEDQVLEIQRLKESIELTEETNLLYDITKVYTILDSILYPGL
ncbi:hypothetical protein PtB15_15B271 [Puccinia triticina]|nr:hypothetical protein PtB15_15B271 [Puccinia triticina]